MQNVSTAVKGDVLTITINLKKRGGESASGKTISIASTQGNIQVPDTDGVILGLNAYVRNPDFKKKGGD